MKSEKTTINLPRDLVARIDGIARQRGLTRAALLWEAVGGYEPPVDATVNEPSGTLTVELFRTIQLAETTPEQTRQLAEGIKRVATVGGGMLDLDAGGVTIARKGSGVVFQAGDLKRSVPPHTALGIAGWLEKAANDAAARLP